MRETQESGTKRRGKHRTPHRIHLRLGDLKQLFNSMDPSPFHDRDLDQDAEEFIESWAQEYPLADPIILTIHMEKEPPPAEQKIVRDAVHNYFKYRARLARMELSRLFHQGRTSLLVGVTFLLGCFLLRELMQGLGDGTIASFARESVLIASWVAMWRPMQTYLYEWWPIRRRQRIFQKLARMPIKIRLRSPREEGHPLPNGRSPSRRTKK